MPYASNTELPPSLQEHLPSRAQDIYREAFNRASERYGAVDTSRIHRIAWVAVKRTYGRIAGQWVRRERLHH